MISSRHQGLVALLCARPSLAILLWTYVEPSAAKYLGYIARVQETDLRIRSYDPETPDAHRQPDAVFTLHEQVALRARGVLVYECQLRPDQRKLYTWLEYPAAARRKHRAWGRVIVFSPVDTVINWARNKFADEPQYCPLLLGRHQLPKITTVDEATLNPELAVFSAVFHGPHEGGAEILLATAHALRTLPKDTRQEYSMVLLEALPKPLMQEVHDITFEEAEAAADEWMRTRALFVMGHEEGREEGREEGEHAGLLKGRLEALADVLELRGLVPTEAEQAKITAADDPELVDHWRVRAKHVASVAELFAD